MGLGINGGGPWPLFLFGVREKDAGEAKGGKKKKKTGWVPNSVFLWSGYPDSEPRSKLLFS